VGDAFLRNTNFLKWEILYIGDPLYRPFPEGMPPFAKTQMKEAPKAEPKEQQLKEQQPKEQPNDGKQAAPGEEPKPKDQ
jgi:hypothetical protein